MHRIKLAVLLAGGLWLTSCYKNTITTDLPSNGVEHEEVVPFLLWGLAGEETFAVNKLCPEGVARIEERKEFTEALFYCVTCGIYSPVRVTVTCSSGAAWRLEPVPEKGHTLAIPVSTTTPEVR